jgi:hypothetical protein
MTKMTTLRQSEERLECIVCYCHCECRYAQCRSAIFRARGLSCAENTLVSDGKRVDEIDRGILEDMHTERCIVRKRGREGKRERELHKEIGLGMSQIWSEKVRER